jgi:hypothetical protein
MARIPFVGPRFLKSRARLSLTQEQAKGIGRTIAILCEGELPLLGSYEKQIPPVASAWVYRVKGENLWLWYTFDETRLYLRTVTATPP